jgi:DNA-binding NarL/FixJ family response regulator
MKFLIADDHDIVRLGVKLLLQRKFSDAQVEEVTDFSTITQRIKENDYDLFILDIHMQETSTIDFIKNLLALKPKLKIIILSYLPEDVFGIHYIKAGAMSYINKKYDNKILSAAIDKVLNNGRYITEEINDQMRQIVIGDNNLFAKLSDREIEVLNYILQGYSVSDISHKMNLHITTISTYKSRIFEKMNTNNIMVLNELATIHKIFKKSE